MSKPSISLVIIALNEAANISRCIKSVPWANEVIVVDSGSTDETVKIAEGCGARVQFEKWRGYREQKIFAASLAKNEWILSLDADEALSSELSHELEKFLEAQSLEQVDGVEFPRLSYNLGRWIHHGGWYPDRQLRLYCRSRAQWMKGHVHERISAQRVTRLTHPILHWPFVNLEEQIRTNNNYSSLGARDLFDRGKKFSLLKLLIKPLSKFLETYLIKRGFLDGLPGFIIAVGAAYSVFLKFAKLRELESAPKLD